MFNNSLKYQLFAAAIFVMVVLGTTSAASPMPPLKNLAQPRPSQFAGGAVAPADVEPLASAGIRHVINLRPVGETPDFDEAGAMSAAGIGYTLLPIANTDDLSLDNVRRLDGALEAHSSQPVLVHCASSNRVGAMMALRAGWLQGLSLEEAVAEGRRWGLNSLEPEVRRRLASPSR